MILQIGATKITCPEDMLDACFFLSAEDQVAIAVERGDQRLDFKVETADLPGHHPLRDVLGSNGNDPLLQPGRSWISGSRRGRRPPLLSLHLMLQHRLGHRQA